MTLRDAGQIKQLFVEALNNNTFTQIFYQCKQLTYKPYMVRGTVGLAMEQFAVPSLQMLTLYTL